MSLPKSFVTLHNLTQSLGWSYILGLTLANIWRDGHLRVDHYLTVPGFKEAVQLF